MQKSDLRIVFMGTPEFAVETLKALVDNDYQVVAVVTQPDKPVGRHGTVLQPSAVKVFAQEHGLPVLQPEKMKDPVFIEQLRSFEANLQVVVAFRMLPEVVWAMPRYGTFNVHAALLPQYRGAAPINWAVINGETMTGVTTFFLDHDIDTGRIIMQLPFSIPDDADAAFVYDGLMHLGADICLQTLERILATDGHTVRGCMGISSFLQFQCLLLFFERCTCDKTYGDNGQYNTYHAKGIGTGISVGYRGSVSTEDSTASFCGSTQARGVGNGSAKHTYHHGQASAVLASHVASFVKYQEEKAYAANHIQQHYTYGNEIHLQTTRLERFNKTRTYL